MRKLYVPLIAAATGLYFTTSMFAATIQVVGNEDPNNTADVTLQILGSSTDTALDLKITILNTSPLYDPTVTGFALNTDPLITGFNAASSILNAWFANFDPGDIDTPQPLGAFDFCAETGSGSVSQCSGGNPANGISPGESGMFTIQFTGSGLLAFGALDFTPVAVRFQETGANGGGSDVAVCPTGDCTPPTPPTPEIPEPSTYLLMGTGLLAMGFFRNRISNRKS